MDPFLRLCAILELDGFEIFPTHTFYPREMAVYSLTTDRAACRRFAIPRHVYDRTSPSDKAVIHHVSNYVHGLSFLPERGEQVSPLAEFEASVLTHYDIMRDPVRCLLGYKGGHHEKKLLEKLNIPALNIEAYGCPKPEDIDPWGPCPFVCGEHEKKGSTLQCSLSKAHRFATWAKARIEGLNRGQTFKLEGREDVRIWVDKFPPTVVTVLQGTGATDFVEKEEWEDLF